MLEWRKFFPIYSSLEFKLYPHSITTYNPQSLLTEPEQFDWSLVLLC